MNGIPFSAAAVAAMFAVLFSVFGVNEGVSVPITTATYATSTAEQVSVSSSFTPSVEKVGIDSVKAVKEEKEILESLALSPILRDGTTPPPPNNNNNDDVKPNGIESEVEIDDVASGLTTTPSSESYMDTNTTSAGNDSVNLKPNINSTSSTTASWSSPLHVARCRAACLEKFEPTTSELAATTTTTEAVPEEESISTIADLHPLLRAKRSSNRVLQSESWSCEQSSADCRSCWKNCELLESSWNSGKVAITTQESKLPCKSSKQCNAAGCQVACNFYQNMFQASSPNEFQDVDPVVAMKHQNALEIGPEKITWPKFPSSSSPVVYVVIQKYPDRNWRQIAQTTNAELAIPGQATSSKTNSAKLNSIRVLVVDKNQVRLVYNPVKAPKLGQADNSTDNPINGLKNNATEFGSSPSTLSNESTTSSHDAPIIQNPFELHVVSLIHQKSLVIAELRWNAAGESQDQDYLITWELSGGGLKGHLVTDSTSVTLSLWPDTSYTIQVETFEQASLDMDGEQPNMSGLQSFPLTVDTGEASFSLEQPSAFLLDMDTEDDYENEENLSVSRGQNEKMSVAMGRTQPLTRNPVALPTHHFTGLLNLTLMVSIAVSALVFVLVILIVAAFTWTRMRAVENYPQWRPTSPSNLDDCSSSPILSPTRNPRGDKFPMNHSHCNNVWAEDCSYHQHYEESSSYFGPGELPGCSYAGETGVLRGSFEHGGVAVISMGENNELRTPLIGPNSSVVVPPFQSFRRERESARLNLYSHLFDDSCKYSCESES